MTIFRRTTHLLPALALGLLFAAACDTTTPGGGAEGRLHVLLTDAPLDDVAEARVTIERVELMGDDGERIILSDEDRSFDLLELQNGVTTTLADVTLPEGTYSEMRIIVAEEATLTFTDGSTSRLKIPSGSASGIKIRFPAFEIDDDNDVIVLTVDFDASRSFVRAGNSGKYIFKPVIKAESLRVNDDERELEDDRRTGAIQEVGADYFVIDGTRFYVDEHTGFGDIDNLASLAAGLQVEVEFVEREDGTFLATEVALVAAGDEG